MNVTHKAPTERGWSIDDPVDGLRRWGSAEVFRLPDHGGTQSIGAASDCDIVLTDPTNCVSQHHARVSRDGATWTITDLDSTNGTFQGGERRLSFQLAPGTELQLGGVTLIAESRRLRELHAFVARIVGWSDAKRVDVDRAMLAIRDAATRETSLILCGAGNLWPTARRLHELALGETRPFVVALETATEALRQAATGTLCVVIDYLPVDFAAVVAANRAAAEPVRLMICAASPEAATEATLLLERTVTVELPPLATRAAEIDQLVLEYAEDAVASLGAPSNGFREHELQWLRLVPLDGVKDLEELGRRVVAVRTWNVVGGAQRLGISHVALSRWLRRRKIPT